MVHLNKKKVSEYDIGRSPYLFGLTSRSITFDPFAVFLSDLAHRHSTQQVGALFIADYCEQTNDHQTAANRSDAFSEGHQHQYWK